MINLVVDTTCPRRQ